MVSKKEILEKKKELDALNDTISFIDTLEVKGVDLEKKIEKHAIDMPMSEFTHESEVEDFYEWARKEFRYFFELGMRASNPLTWEDIETIGKLRLEAALEFRKKELDASKSIKFTEEEFCSEVLKRFKAQKGGQ